MKDPVAELRETGLYSSLLRDSPDFAARIERLVAGLSPLLASTVRHFPYYTRHDAHHGYKVARRIEQTARPACFALALQLPFFEMGAPSDRLVSSAPV
jgi:hypothetical protein